MNSKIFFFFFLLVAVLITPSSFSQSASPSHKKLIFAVDLIRHGDRTPLMNIPTVPYTWAEGLEQLTPTGSQQEFSLGKHLRERYITHSHLLPKHYLPGTISVRSTGSDRTIMSANAVIAGLYAPDFKHAPYPILPPTHNCPRPQEDLLLADNDFNFKFHPLLESTVLLLPEWQSREAALKENFPRWSEALGIPINNLYDLKNVGDTLFIHQLYDLPKPPLLSEKDMATIMDTEIWAICTTFQNKVLGQAAAANLLQEILESFQTAVESNQQLRYRLYAAHDSTLLVLLAALGIATPLKTIPPYASDLSLELFEEGNGGYTVQVTLNEEPIILSCSGKNSCTLEQLKTLSTEASAQLKKVQARAL